MTKGVIERTTFTKCEVCIESIIRALLQQRRNASSGETITSTHDLELLSILSLENALSKPTATIATAQGMTIRDGADHKEGFDITCAAAVDSEIMAAPTVSYTLRNGLMKYIKSVLDNLQYTQLSQTQRKYLLNAKCLITPKETAEGVVFDKIKARLVVLGNLQIEDHITTTIRSPSPSLQTIFIQAAIAAAKGRHVFTFNAGQAFLNAQLKMSGCEDLILRLSKPNTEIFIKLDPT